MSIRWIKTEDGYTIRLRDKTANIIKSGCAGQVVWRIEIGGVYLTTRRLLSEAKRRAEQALNAEHGSPR